MTFTTQATQASELRVNIFYYAGWTLRLDGNIALLNIDPLNGAMPFVAPVGVHQAILEFGDTPTRTIGQIISWVSLLVWAGMAGRDRRRNQNFAYSYRNALMISSCAA